MWKPSTRVIEISGIMGAGYLPSMLKELQTQLMNNFSNLLPDGTRAPLIVMYHVDNTVVKKWNPYKRRRIKELIRKEDANADLQRFVDAVKLHDELFREAVEDWRKPVDLVFRRGGSLQAFKRLNQEKWRTAIIQSVESPKLQVFLLADEEAIAHTFANDVDVKRVFEREPDVYNTTPEQAFDEQELWLKCPSGDFLIQLNYL
jgi:hypothetical protein